MQQALHFGAAGPVVGHTGQTVVVTGAAREIGLELGRFFGRAGADVLVFGYDREETAKAAADTGASRSGRIVNVTSCSGLHGNVGQANYATAKAGIIGFTRTTAKELARFGVTVNVISPNAEARMVASSPAEKKAELAAGIPLGRFADPARCAPPWPSSPPARLAPSGRTRRRSGQPRRSDGDAAVHRRSGDLLGLRPTSPPHRATYYPPNGAVPRRCHRCPSPAAPRRISFRWPTRVHLDHRVSQKVPAATMTTEDVDKTHLCR
ncbi:SDR family NAD(P)-dependent oxidoreductase [Streptomyces bobili]|uniref:SDR family NAD(P)-dependent oxidoreductase n=1 Tax=Streptomyces bobili TaxID=67280 RepID=UPI00364DB727